MAGNRRRHANAIPLASLATWVVIGVFVCVAGLGYVWCKNQLYATGTQVKNIERELAELRSKNELMRTNISRLSSTATIQERYNSGFIKLVPITNERIVVVSGKPGIPAGNELRAVSNQRMQE